MLRASQLLRARRVAVPLVAAALAALAVVGWQGVTTAGRNAGIDAPEHIRYAQYLDQHGSLPPKSENYEYSSPPLFAALAIAAGSVAHHVPVARLELSSNLLTRLLWVLLVAVAAVALVSSRRAVRRLGLAAAGAALLWGVDEALSLARTEAWSAGQLVSLVAFLVLVVTTGAIVRELHPRSPPFWAAAAAIAVAFPVTLRLGVIFHPEMTFAALCAVATLCAVRAARRGWTVPRALTAGVSCGAAAWARQPAVVVIAAVVIVAAAAAGRRSLPYLAAFAAAAAVVAGPWWIHQGIRYGNPLQSNLDRPGYMLPHGQPRSFYVSFPVADLVRHPYRPSFQDQLLPKLHADLWSDWFGGLHDFWDHPTHLDRFLASSQSVLGFGGDVLALGGLFAFGFPAALRVAQRRFRGDDVPLSLLAVVAVGGFAAFVLTLIRFPQTEGDPIKSSYLLFTTPCWAVFAALAARWIWRAGFEARLAFVGFVILYATSYVATVATTFT